jgi:hypothetical protein
LETNCSTVETAGFSFLPRNIRFGQPDTPSELFAGVDNRTGPYNDFVLQVIGSQWRSSGLSGMHVAPPVGSKAKNYSQSAFSITQNPANYMCGQLPEIAPSRTLTLGLSAGYVWTYMGSTMLPSAIRAVRTFDGKRLARR